MLKKYWVLRNPDANTEGASSNPSTSDETAAAPSTAEVTETGAGAKPTESIASVAKEVFDKQTSSQEEPNEGDVPNEDKGAEKATTEVEEVNPVVDDSKLPFHEHPRWKEVTQKSKEYEQKVTEYEPLVKQIRYHNDFMAEHGITSEEVAQAMNILALQKSDPAKARELMKPMWDNLMSYDENALPPEFQNKLNGLKSAVEDGTITKEFADQYETDLRETAKLKQQARIGQARGVKTAEQQARQAQSQMMGSLNSWDQATRRSNPDFKPKNAESDVDGLYEVTAAKLSYLMQMKNPTTSQEAVAMVDKAFKEAKQLFSGRLNSTKTVKPLVTSTSSSASGKKEPTNLKDVVKKAAAEHGIQWNS